MNNSRKSTGTGGLRHFLSIEGLNRKLLTDILDAAEVFLRGYRADRQEGPAAARQNHRQSVLRSQHAHAHHLRARRQAALRRCPQHQHHPVETVKGETLLDTLRNLEAMHVRYVRGPARRQRGRALHRAPRRAACQCHQRRRRRGTPTRPRPCWTCSPSGESRGRTSGDCVSPSSATSCIRAWRAPRSTP